MADRVVVPTMEQDVKFPASVFKGQLIAVSLTELRSLGVPNSVIKELRHLSDHDHEDTNVVIRKSVREERRS